MVDINDFGQPLGALVAGWSARPVPPHTPMSGGFCDLEPIELHHARGLHEADNETRNDAVWTYLSVGPFHALEDYERWCARVIAQPDPLFFVIRDKQGRVLGRLSLMRIDPANGVIEIGHILFSPALQRTTAATEAIFLLMRRAFDELGYRRLEWKCDALNAASRAAALRLGFQFEGIFRHAMIVKNRSRDTAWYSIIDSEWPALRGAFETWLAPENFDANGKQRARLGDVIAARRGR